MLIITIPSLEELCERREMAINEDFQEGQTVVIQTHI